MGQRDFSFKGMIMAMEINKHKWLESEKAGKDIGFVAATVDWLHKYSDNWYKYYSEKSLQESLFIERRNLRRFKLVAQAKLVSPDGLCLGKVINLSFTGAVCSSANDFPVGSRIRLHITFGKNDKQSLSCIALVERVFFSAETKRYEIFFKFSENIWQSLLGLECLERKEE